MRISLFNRIGLNRFSRCLLALLAFCASVASLAEGAIFGEQRQVAEVQPTEVQHSLTLGALKKIDAQWVAEREERVAGKRSSVTYELGQPYSLKSAWDALQKHYQKKSAALIFECEGFSCGSSNAWANERFGVANLYGIDNTQHYQVWQLDEPRQFHTVYLVQRGNKRIYAHIETLVPDDTGFNLPPSASVYARRLYADGSLMIPLEKTPEGEYAVNTKQWKEIARALNEQPYRRFSVNALVPENAEEVAQRFRAVLLASGIRKRRIVERSEGRTEDAERHPVIEITLQK